MASVLVPTRRLTPVPKYLNVRMYLKLVCHCLPLSNDGMAILLIIDYAIYVTVKRL